MAMVSATATDHSLAYATTFAPLSYCTPTSYSAKTTTLYFKAPFCNQEDYYNLYTATVTINLINSPWTVSQNRFIVVNVYGDPKLTTLIANNTGLVPQFKFTYLSTDGDLYLEADVPASPGDLQFVIDLTWEPPAASADLKALEYEARKNRVQVARSWSLLADPQPIALKQYYSSPTTIFSTTTFGDLLLTFLFCPASQAYSATATTVCLNEGCGISTFMCVNTKDFPCNAVNAQTENNLDNSATAISSITVSTQAPTFSIFQLYIVDDSNYQTGSQFTVGVTTQQY